MIPLLCIFPKFPMFQKMECGEEAGGRNIHPSAKVPSSSPLGEQNRTVKGRRICSDRQKPVLLFIKKSHPWLQNPILIVSWNGAHCLAGKQHPCELTGTLVAELHTTVTCVRPASEHPHRLANLHTSKNVAQSSLCKIGFKATTYTWNFSNVGV